MRVSIRSPTRRSRWAKKSVVTASWRISARSRFALAALLRGLEDRVAKIEGDYDIYRDALDIVQRLQAAQARPMSGPSDPDDEAKH